MLVVDSVIAVLVYFHAAAPASLYDARLFCLLTRLLTLHSSAGTLIVLDHCLHIKTLTRQHTPVLSVLVHSDDGSSLVVELVLLALDPF